MRVDLPLLKNVFTQQANSFLLSLRLTTAVSVTKSAIPKKIRLEMRPGILNLRLADLAQRTTLTISNEQNKDVMKIVKPLAESGLLIKSIFFNSALS